MVEKITKNHLKQLDFKSIKYHRTGAILGIIFNPIFAITDYFNISDVWVNVFILRVSISIITLCTLLIWKKKKFRSFFLVFIPFLLISLQNAYTYSLIDNQHIVGHSLNFLALLIGASIFILWTLKYSIIVSITSLISSLGFTHLNDQITYDDFFTKGGLLVITVMIFMILIIETRYKLTLNELILQNKLQNANKDLNNQKSVLEVKNNHITESIRYAKSIQDSILGSTEKAQSIFYNSFVFFRPKDIVSGDFYFFHEDKEENIKIVVCADCTGHGVPAALMTTIGINALKLIVAQNKTYKPSNILTQLDSMLAETLSNNQQEQTIRDGMDISIISVKDNKLTFAGAKNPLIYLPFNQPIKRIKGDRISIGNDGYKDKTFADVEINVNKGDKIYLFTDGFQDQMSEKTDKKYMSKKFRRFLESIGKKHDIHDQSSVIEQEFNSWKGSAEQTDDVLIIGLEF